MSLTSGRGPLSPQRAGWFSAAVPLDVVYVEPFPRRIRARRGTTFVIDTQQVLLVHRPGSPPAYALPEAAIPPEVPSTPVAEAPGYRHVRWDAVDEWLEENEPVINYPRNPYHRVDYLRTDRRLRVELDDVVLVDTNDTIGAFETALEPRLYVSRRAVRMDLLETSSTTTFCRYKGRATWFSATVGDSTVADVAWSYEEPFDESRIIAGLLAFDPARASVFEEFPL